MNMQKPPEEMTNAEMAATLMRQAAQFFMSIGQQNPAIQDQMAHNAQTFEQVAALLEADPTGKPPTQPPQNGGAA